MYHIYRVSSVSHQSIGVVFLIQKIEESSVLGKISAYGGVGRLFAGEKR